MTSRPLENTRQAIAFVKRHGIVLQSAQRVTPSLAEAIAGEAIRGSWWSHPRSSVIYRVMESVGASDKILTCKLLGGKVTLVHRRLWPAIVKLAARFPKGSLDKVWNEHTERGAHAARRIAFPRWVTAEVQGEAERLERSEAEALLAPWLEGGASKYGNRGP